MENLLSLSKPTYEEIEHLISSLPTVLIGLSEEKPEGGYTFVLDGSSYEIEDVLEISKIAEQHGYIVIY